METKHLSHNSRFGHEQRLVQSCEIEVPAGESRFLISQVAGDAVEQQYTFHLRHADSRVTVLGLIEARGETGPRLRTEVIHHHPSTQAETIIRTLSYDKAQPRYEGLIRMEPGAHNSESYLNHHSLLLGELAKSWTLPSLEILADQVKCSHAATLRSIQDLDLFYLRSRGISSDEARELVITAFLADVADCRNV